MTRSTVKSTASSRHPPALGSVAALSSRPLSHENPVLRPPQFPLNLVTFRNEQRLKFVLRGTHSLKVGQLWRNPGALRGVHKREAANYGGNLLKTAWEMSLVRTETVSQCRATDGVKVTATVCHRNTSRQFIQPCLTDR